jgi:hypothetical protein
MGGDEDDSLSQTTPFSVATLRNLVSRSADMSEKSHAGSPSDARREQEEPPRRRRSAPALDVLARGAAVLEFPKSRSTPPAAPVPSTDSPVAESRPPTLPPKPAARGVSPSLPSVIVEREAVLDVVADVVELVPFPRATRPRRRRDTVALVEAFLKCRLVALLLLAIAVVAPPSWWNVGDLRPPHALLRALAAQRNAQGAPVTSVNIGATAH